MRKLSGFGRLSNRHVRLQGYDKGGGSSAMSGVPSQLLLYGGRPLAHRPVGIGIAFKSLYARCLNFKLVAPVRLPLLVSELVFIVEGAYMVSGDAQVFAQPGWGGFRCVHFRFVDYPDIVFF